MSFVSFKDLYEMVVNYFEGLEDDQIMLAFMHHDKREPMLKRFDSYLTIGEHGKAEKRAKKFCCGNRKFKEDSVVFHGDGCLWDSAKRPNAEQGEDMKPMSSSDKTKLDGLSATCYVIDDIPFEVAIVKNRRDGWCACHSDPYRKNEESTHSEKEVEEKPLKDEKERKTNDEKFSSLEKFGLATNWASAMTMVNARDFLLSVSSALSDINEKLKQEVKLEPVEEPKKDILKVKCVRAYTGCTLFIEGKVYERVNGVLVAEDAFPFEYLCKGNDPNKWMFPDHRFELYEEPVEEPVEEPKKDILKVKCTYSTGSEFIEGKVYERVNGVLMSEHGFDYWALCKDNDPSKWSFIGLFSGKPFYKFELYEEPKKPEQRSGRYPWWAEVRRYKCTHKRYFCDYFTVGKVYDVVNGVLTDDEGDEWDCDDVDPSKWDFDADFELCPNDLEVKCMWISNPVSESWTVGKVYKRVDGVLFDDAGYEWGNHMCNGDDPTKWAFTAARFELYEEPKEEPKKDILKVKCVWVENPRYWTVGKVYERVNGVLVDETGYTWERLCVRDDPTKWLFDHVKFELAE